MPGGFKRVSAVKETSLEATGLVRSEVSRSLEPLQAFEWWFLSIIPHFPEARNQPTFIKCLTLHPARHINCSEAPCRRDFYPQTAKEKDNWDVRDTANLLL